ncbi:MAG: hypothetical protein AB1847_02685 [bacterium]
MLRKLSPVFFTAFIGALLTCGVLLTYSTVLAQFSGTHTYAIRIGTVDQGYLTVTFNSDGSITGNVLLSDKEAIPLSGVYGKSIFVIKYKLDDGTEVLDHCRFISEDEFIGFERYTADNGDSIGMTKINGLRKDKI